MQYQWEQLLILFPELLCQFRVCWKAVSSIDSLLLFHNVNGKAAKLTV